MEIDKLNSLVELYFKKCEEVDPSKPFLRWLKSDKPTYSWKDVKKRIFKLSYKISTLINEGDRCLILSENRPYWLIADIAVMNAGGISVPIFTTYSSNDYAYILNDCKPSLIIVSNDNQFKKIKKLAKSNVQLLGFLGKEKMLELLKESKAFIFAAEEDFGIAPIEAQAAGVPVIAYGKGGILETVNGAFYDEEQVIKSDITGVFFHKQTTDSLLKAINFFEKNKDKFNKNKIRNNALKFSKERFEMEFKLAVENIYINWKENI